VRRTFSRRDIGAAAEARAAHLLEESGLRILARNYRTRLGEIDLVARDGEALVFIEVRTRSRPEYGGAAESINRRKQRRIIAAARMYLRGTGPTPCRFDAVLFSEELGAVEWVRDAFRE
jgi:putative endonuclease